MQLKYGLISVDDHIQETPDLWTQRLSKNRWGDRFCIWSAPTTVSSAGLLMASA
jgi:hypothetical protein